MSAQLSHVTILVHGLTLLKEEHLLHIQATVRSLRGDKKLPDICALMLAKAETTGKKNESGIYWCLHYSKMILEQKKIYWNRLSNEVITKGPFKGP